MTFDPRAYEDTVLKPMRRLLPNLPDDLQARYAVDPSMDAAALRERVETVVKLWNKFALRPGHGGMVAKQLAYEHREFEAAGQDLGTPAFWTAWFARRQQSVGTAIDALAAQLRDEYGTLGVITRQQLREAAEGALADAELDKARAKAGLQVVEPVALPAKPAMRGQFKVLNDALIEAGVQSVPELLFPDLTSFGLLDGLSVQPLPPGRTARLTVDAASERMVELDKLPDSGRVRAERAAVGLLITEAKGGVDLTGLALFHLLQSVREKQAQGVGPGTLFAQLSRKKLQRSDAGRIVVSLLAEGVVRRDPAAEVIDLLAEGRLLAAQQIAASLSGEDGDAARAAVARVHEQVAALRSAAKEHLRAGRDEQAGDALRQAVALADDVPELAAELAGMPAPPVLAVAAVADGSGVRVTWRAAPGHPASTVFGVVRGPGREPDSVDDGTKIPVSADHGTDAAPPVGTDVHYGVLARVGNGRWSRPVAASVRVVPPVSDVVVEGGKGVVTGRWRAHPDVAAVEVRRASGTPDAPAETVRVDGNKQFRDESVRDGVQYFYTVVAIYPTAGGAALRSAPVSVRGASRVDAGPVTSLSATMVGGDRPTVRLTWRQKAGSEVALRRAAAPCPWEYGTRVSRSDVQGWGHELRGDLTVRGESMTLVVSAPPGRSWIVPFTAAADAALRGQDAYIELIEPVRSLAAQRFGDDVRITWIWPDEVSAADVTWTGGRRRITLAQYREEGGVQLRSVGGVRRVDVEAVVLSAGGDETCSPAVSVVVEDRPLQLSYELSRRGHRLAGGVKATVTLTCSAAVPVATLVLVGSSGSVMPRTADAGIELQRESVRVQPGVPLTLPEVPLPPVLRRPYWLRCFITEPIAVQLLDPPVSQLKVP